MDYKEIEIEWMKEILSDKEKEIKRLEKDRDFFKEQATLWRNDYKKEYEENIKLKSELSQYKEYNSNLMKEIKLCYKSLEK